jgi:hypothetical protein
MPINQVTPQKVMESVHRGFDRFSNFRSARLMFLRNFCGQYYDRESGDVGTEPLNLIFNAIRSLVPHIVMSFPKHTVASKYLFTREYGELLGLALDQHSKDIDIKSVYRRVIVDAIFTLGILKTGLAESDTILALDEYDNVDAGTIYTEGVDFDDFVADPNSKEHLFRDAAWLGHRMCVPRRLLLDSGLYKNDLIERLPRAGDNENRARDLSQRGIDAEDNYGLEDEVEVVELWVPSANAMVTVPGSKDITFDDYLRIDDYYGPKEGPYTLLALTPPVPGNPLPVPAVGVWNDLHILANRMAHKIVEQATRQKDNLVYKRSAADDAQELLDAKDGEAIASDDPDGVRVLSTGGQQQSNEVHLAQLQQWFNMMASNPDQLAGAQVNAGSATEARLLQGNANIGLDDMKDLVYSMAAGEARKRAWFLHTDPLINLPLIRRKQVPAQYAPGPAGPMMMQPAMMQEEQIILTPEARRGEFLDYVFTIEPESMGRKDSKTRFAEAMDFAAKVLPAAATAAQTFAMLGIPFSPKEFILRMAKDMGIDWMQEVFYDPEFQMMMAQRLLAGPQMEGSKGQVAGGGMMDQLLQNGQPASIGAGFPSPTTQVHQDEQAGANPGQSTLKKEVAY